MTIYNASVRDNSRHELHNASLHVSSKHFALIRIMVVLACDPCHQIWPPALRPSHVVMAERRSASVGAVPDPPVANSQVAYPRVTDRPAGPAPRLRWRRVDVHNEELPGEVQPRPRTSRNREISPRWKAKVFI